jgi:hypothetical protein
MIGLFALAVCVWTGVPMYVYVLLFVCLLFEASVEENR